MFTRKFLRWLKIKKEKRIENHQFEKQAFLKTGQEQLKELAKRGLSIPVFTL